MVNRSVFQFGYIRYSLPSSSFVNNPYKHIWIQQREIVQYLLTIKRLQLSFDVVHHANGIPFAVGDNTGIVHSGPAFFFSDFRSGNIYNA